MYVFYEVWITSFLWLSVTKQTRHGFPTSKPGDYRASISPRVATKNLGKALPNKHYLNWMSKPCASENEPSLEAGIVLVEDN